MTFFPFIPLKFQKFLNFFFKKQATSNYLARKFGVRSAIPGFIAKKLCPDLVIVPCDMHKYIRESNIVRSIFQYYDPNMFMGGLDEAYLDLTDFVGQRIFPGF